MTLYFSIRKSLSQVRMTYSNIYITIKTNYLNDKDKIPYLKVELYKYTFYA